MKFRRAFLVVALLGAVAAAAIPSQVGAYGGSSKLYEVTVSANCDNPASPLCAPFPDGFGLGGTWQWYEVDGAAAGATSGTADGTLTFCAHGSPSFHANVSDVPWFMATGAQLAAFNAGLPLGEQIFPTDFPGSPSEVYIVIPAGGVAVPATPGHYSVKAGPGVQIQSTVSAVS